MPPTYISRYVFDRNHINLAICEEDTPLGAICFRHFPEQKFCEIVFMGISSKVQVQGYGTKLMNYLKQYAVENDIQYLLTFADNFAIGYFKKQGFRKEIEMPVSRFKPFIKHYDGGTLMECYVHPTIPFLNVDDVIEKQRKFVCKSIEDELSFDLSSSPFDGLKPGTKLKNEYLLEWAKSAGWSDNLVKMSQLNSNKNKRKRSDLA